MRPQDMGEARTLGRGRRGDAGEAGDVSNAGFAGTWAMWAATVTLGHGCRRQRGRCWRRGRRGNTDDARMRAMQETRNMGTVGRSRRNNMGRAWWNKAGREITVYKLNSSFPLHLCVLHLDESVRYTLHTHGVCITTHICHESHKCSTRQTWNTEKI